MLASTETTSRGEQVRRGDAYGTEESKLKWLAGNSFSLVNLVECQILPPENLFVPLDPIKRSEFREFPSMREVMDRNGDPAPGIVTTHDEFAIAFTPSEAMQNVDLLLQTADEKAARLIFRLCTQSQWNYASAKKALASGTWKEEIKPLLYRPFDNRFTVYNAHVAVHRRTRASDNMLLVGNVAVIIPRACEIQRGWEHVWCSDRLVQHHTVSIKEVNYFFPLWLRPHGTETRTLSNIAPAFANRVAALTGLAWDDCVEGPKQGALAGVIAPKPTQTAMFATRRERGDPGHSFGPRDLFDWIYAVLHSPAYRSRYADYLKSDFARVPLPDSAALFEALVPIGTDLVATHLLDAEHRFGPDRLPILADPKGIRLAGTGEARVTQAPTLEGGRVYINPTRWFETVPEIAWNFHIGGYQPAQKWLKDRAAKKSGKKANPGRVLTDEDILHYRRIILALTRTAELMPKIDAIVEEHGGWPGAFRGMADEVVAEAAE